MNENPTQQKRIKISELEDSIFRPNNATVLDPDNSIDPFVITYTIKGKEDEIDNSGLPVLHDEIHRRHVGKDVMTPAEQSEYAYAKKTFNGNRYRYYVKMNQRGDLYNPRGLYEGGYQRKKHESGEPIWAFREVNLRAFELYTSFLKTGNIAWLHNAERAYR